MLYRWLLRLYPHDFRRQYQDELEADFDILRTEAVDTGGRAALFRCYLRAAADLLRSVPREWLRTPWIPVIVAAGVIASLIFYYVVGRVYVAGSFATGTPPPESPALVLLMAAMVIVPMVVMVVIGIASRFRSMKPRERQRRV